MIGIRKLEEAPKLKKKLCGIEFKLYKKTIKF